MLPDGYRYSVDSDNTAKIKYDTEKAIDLADFTDALVCIDKMYQSIATDELPNSIKADLGEPHLYLQGVNKGSIELFLAIQNIPYLQTFGKHLLEVFLNKLKTLFDRIKNKQELGQLSKQELLSAAKISNPIAKDASSQLNIGLVNYGTYSPVYLMTNGDANEIYFNSKEELALREEKQEDYFNKVAFKWSVADFDKKGDKAIVYKLSNKPVKVIFENNLLKDKMHSYNLWHKQIFIVDLEVTLKDGNPILYKIMNVYFDDTYVDAND